MDTSGLCTILQHGWLRVNLAYSLQELGIDKLVPRFCSGIAWAAWARCSEMIPGSPHASDKVTPVEAMLEEFPKALHCGLPSS